LYETLALLRGQFEQAHITTKLSINDEPLFVAGDHGLLKQLFLNLFMNAIEAISSTGELVVRVTRCSKDVGNAVLVEIEDTGPGIPEELLGRVFDPFVTTKQHGSGLGLSICRGIADAHHALIHARNVTEGHGVHITVEFPAAEQPSTIAI
jgi:signal transduction histidine kinase